MGRQVSKAEGKGILALLILGVPVFLIAEINEAFGWVVPVAIIAIVVALVFWYRELQAQKRRAYLRDKHRNEEVVQKILKRMFLQGQTEELLRNSLGDPADIRGVEIRKRFRQQQPG